MQNVFTLLLAVASHASAEVVFSNQNLTVAFFADDQTESCKSNDISSAMTLTTSTVPISYTCFNVADLFSQSNSTGFQNVTQPIYDNNHQPLEPNGISWTLINQENYDANANYSSVWYHQQNLTDPEEGARSRWVLFTYAFEDCNQIGADLEPDDYDDWPWFKVSCQTDEDGECHTTPRPIRSFAINKAYVYEDDEDRCMAWAKQGAGVQVRIGYGHLVLAGTLALWAVM